MPRTKLAMALWALVAINVAALFYIGVVAPRMAAQEVLDLGQGDYALQATDGSVFTKETLVGAPTAVFFGFTHCPDVCPTTLGDILTWQEELDGTEDLNIYFVTVDPSRDTADILGEYVGWVPGVRGVTGSEAEVAKAIQSFKVYAAKVPLDGGGYTMDHSASVLLFDDNGQYSDRVRYQEDPAIAVEKIRKILGS